MPQPPQRWRVDWIEKLGSWPLYWHKSRRKKLVVQWQLLNMLLQLECVGVCGKLVELWSCSCWSMASPSDVSSFFVHIFAAASCAENPSIKGQIDRSVPLVLLLGSLLMSTIKPLLGMWSSLSDVQPMRVGNRWQLFSGFIPPCFLPHGYGYILVRWKRKFEPSTAAKWKKVILLSAWF